MIQNMASFFDAEAEKHDEMFIRDLGLEPFYDAVQTALENCGRKEKVLVLGCGSGLEIERIHFSCQVTGVDLSTQMLETLKRKKLHEGVQLSTICASFLEWDFGSEHYDIVLSCYAMHHFSEEQKTAIYRKIYGCLNPDGVFINGDLIAADAAAEKQGMQKALAIYQEKGMPFASLHVDVPFCWPHECHVLGQAGFPDVRLIKEWTNTKLYECLK